MEHEIHVLESLAEIPAADWNRLAGPQPFLQHAFLHGLELTGCVGGDTGWIPRHVALRCNGAWVAAAPLYEKHHSFGEFVFDWAWARAYQQHGLTYYPKLLCAVPFTPVAGPRLLVSSADWMAPLVAAIGQVQQALEASSVHVLFPPEPARSALVAGGALLRQGVQFHWHNKGYTDFESFLATLSRDKRKKIRQERRRVADAGVVLRRVKGAEVTADEWQFFHRCYRTTYRQHGSTPYLNAAFFRHLGAHLASHVLLVIAERDGLPIAAALDLYDSTHWGAIEQVPALHFEACYYQGLEFCIEQGIGTFEGGAQGEHKLARGFMPVTTWSTHQIADPRFASAIGDFLDREGQGISHYVSELEEHAPFRKPAVPPAAEPADEPVADPAAGSG